MNTQVKRSPVEHHRRAVEIQEQRAREALQQTNKPAKPPVPALAGDTFEAATSSPLALAPRVAIVDPAVAGSLGLAPSSSPPRGGVKRGLSDDSGARASDLRQELSSGGRGALEERLTQAKQEETDAKQHLAEAEQRREEAQAERDDAKARFDDALHNGSERQIDAMSERLAQADAKLGAYTDDVGRAQRRLDDARRAVEDAERALSGPTDPPADAPPPTDPPGVDARTPPPATTPNDKLRALLDERPDLRNNQDVINHCYATSDGTWSGAEAKAGEYGLSLDALVADREGDPRASLPEEAPPTQEPPSDDTGPTYTPPSDRGPIAGTPSDDTGPTLAPPADDSPSRGVSAEASELGQQLDRIDAIDDKNQRREATLEAVNALTAALEGRAADDAVALLDELGPSLEAIGRGFPELKPSQTQDAVAALSRAGEVLGDENARKLTDPIARGMVKDADGKDGGGMRRDGYHDGDNEGELHDSLKAAVGSGNGASFAVALADSVRANGNEGLTRAAHAGVRAGVDQLVDDLKRTTGAEQEHLAEIADFASRTDGLLTNEERQRGIASFEGEREARGAERDEAAAKLSEATGALLHADVDDVNTRATARRAVDALELAAGTESGDRYLSSLLGDSDAFRNATRVASDADRVSAACVQGSASSSDRSSAAVRELLSQGLSQRDGFPARTAAALDVYSAMESGEVGALLSSGGAAGAEVAKLFGKGGLASHLGAGARAVGAVFDAYDAVEAFRDGDKVKGALHLAGAVSAGLALAGVGGPVGGAIGVMSAVGIIGLDLYRGIQEDRRVGREYERFLDAAIGPERRKNAGDLLDYAVTPTLSEAMRALSARYGVPAEHLAARAFALDETKQNHIAWTAWEASRHDASLDDVLAAIERTGIQNSPPYGVGRH